MKKKTFWILFAICLVLIYIFFFNNSGCDPDACIAKSRVFCNNNKIVNLTYACINGECQVFNNNSFDCDSLTERSCLNNTVISLNKYYCMNLTCVNELKTETCEGKETCIEGYCKFRCGNGVIDENENCENCPVDVKCKNDENCINGVCVLDSDTIRTCRSDEDCQDDNPCTVDSCDKQKGKCSNEFIKNLVPSFCCSFDNDCDDGELCTEDLCINHRCQHSKLESCCKLDSDCDDDNVCTVDSCRENKCEYEYKVSLSDICCNRDEDCADKNVCTIDFCTGENLNRKCMNTKILDCCNTNDDCVDDDACTLDSCENNKCVNKIFTRNESYANKGLCSKRNATIYESCVTDLYIDLEKSNLSSTPDSICNKDDCLYNKVCWTECSVVRENVEYICKKEEWVARI